MKSLADLQVSRCGRFAKIFNSNGEYFLIWSKANGIYMISSGIEYSVINERDAAMLLKKLKSSSLPNKDTEVEIEVQITLIKWNTIHIQFPKNKIDEQVIAEEIDSLKNSGKLIMG